MLTFVMKISIWEFFEKNCSPKSEQCKKDVENHLDDCFDNNIAMNTINQQNSVKKCKSNVKLVLSFEQCLAVKVGYNYWENIDLPSTFYKLINDKRISKGKAPYAYPCDAK